MIKKIEESLILWELSLQSQSIQYAYCQTVDFSWYLKKKFAVTCYHISIQHCGPTQ